MKSSNKPKGHFAEVHAAAFLRRHGYSLLARNYAYRGGELDLVARDSNGEIVFVEVKSSWGKDFGLPESRVTQAKQTKMWRTACHYLYATAATECACRFDVIAVDCLAQGLEIRHFKNAFVAQNTIPEC